MDSPWVEDVPYWCEGQGHNALITENIFLYITAFTLAIIKFHTDFPWVKDMLKWCEGGGVYMSH